MADEELPNTTEAPTLEQTSPVLDKIKSFEEQQAEKKPEPAKPTIQGIDYSKLSNDKKGGYEAQALINAKKAEIELPYVQQTKELELREKQAKAHAEELKLQQARKAAEEQEQFSSSKEGREAKRLQQEAQIAAAQAQARRIIREANPGIVAEAKQAIQSNLPRASPEQIQQIRKLFTPTEVAPAGYLATQIPGQTNALQPAYADLGGTQIRARINPATNQTEYYIADRGAVSAQQIGGNFANSNGQVSPSEILLAMGGTGARTFENQALSKYASSDLLRQIGGTTPYPTSADPVEVARGKAPEFIPENPAQVERYIDRELAREEIPAPSVFLAPRAQLPPPAPRPILVQAPVPRPAAIPVPPPRPKIVVQKPKPKPVVMEKTEKPEIVVVKPEVKVELERPKRIVVPIHQKIRIRRHAHAGAPRKPGKPTRKALRERERRARIKAERLQLRG